MVGEEGRKKIHFLSLFSVLWIFFVFCGRHVAPQKKKTRKKNARKAVFFSGGKGDIFWRKLSNHSKSGRQKAKKGKNVWKIQETEDKKEKEKRIYYFLFGFVWCTWHRHHTTHRDTDERVKKVVFLPVVVLLHFCLLLRKKSLLFICVIIDAWIIPHSWN